MNKKNIANTTNLFNVPQAAKFLGVNPGTIRRWVHNNQLKGIKVGIRGDWRFTKQDLLKMIQNSEPQAELVLAPIASLDQLINSSHVVQFYDNETFLINSIKEYIHKGDVAIIIAKKSHLDKLQKVLSAKENGEYIYLDAAVMLNKFMVNGMPDPERFFNEIGVLIAQVGKGKQHVRAYGEMVALLWEEGNQMGAIKLEELWNNLQKILPFSLFCSYPMQDLGGEKWAVPFSEVCVQHSGVLPTEEYALKSSPDERLRVIASLQQKAQSLEKEIERRKLLEKQKDEFMAVVSHELRTPVTSLKAYAQALQNQFTKAGDLEAAGQLNKMDGQINKLTTLISDLLDVTKLESGKISYQQKYFLFDELVNEVIEEVQRTTKNHKIIKSGKSTKKVYGDRDRLGQVITNFLTNAIKYSPNNKKIIVTVWTDKLNLRFSVQDFGMGINKDEQPYIFDRFYRVAGDSQQTFPGLGLGLYISSQIIRGHKGSIQVESTKGNGSIFSFTLPLKKDK